MVSGGDDTSTSEDGSETETSEEETLGEDVVSGGDGTSTSEDGSEIETSEEEKKEDEFDFSIVRENKEGTSKTKQLINKILTSKFSKTLGRVAFTGGSIGLGLLSASIPGVIAGITIGFVAPILAKKLKLWKLVKKGFDNRKIVFKEEEELKLIDEYNEKLENQMYDLLSKPNNSYKLEITRLKYVNQIELLEKTIEVIRKQLQNDGYSFKRSIILKNREKQLEKAKERLAQLDEYIISYNNIGDNVISIESKVGSLNSEIRENAETLKELRKDPEANSGQISDLMINTAKLLKQRDKKAGKLISQKRGISPFAIAIGLKSLEKGSEKQETYFIEEEEENVKTR